METQPASAPAASKIHSASMVLSAAAQSTVETAEPELDRMVHDVKAKAREFARLPIAEKRRLLDACRVEVHRIAPEWVQAACQAKGIPFGTPRAAEEWLGGPFITLRNLRCLEESLAAIEQSGSGGYGGKPPLGRSVTQRPDGRIEVTVAPSDLYDVALFGGFSAKVVMQSGMTEAEVRQRQAAFYSQKEPQGGVALVLGAGNVASIPPTDSIYKMFVEGMVCILKMNPVNEYLGPLFERALKPLIERGYLRVVYGGGAAGAFLTQHPLVDDVHITGSDRTHDMIVWGPPGPERERRMREKDPLLSKPITSELGNVSPVIIVPGNWSDADLWFQARNVATMIVNNASFNCNAAKILVTSAAWPARERFRRLILKALGEVPLRRAYYPGAHERYRTLTEGRSAERVGQPQPDELPWTFITSADPKNATDPLWCTEPFCGIITEAPLEASEPAQFLREAARFCNDRLWGTLNAAVIVHPTVEREPQVAAALSQAIDDLRYGTVGINHWPAVGYGFASAPWGGHPSATLENIQSGLGWVHNTYMLEGIEKVVIRGPFRPFPKPPWFYDHKNAHRVAEKLIDFEARPSWLKVVGIAIAALQG